MSQRSPVRSVAGFPAAPDPARAEAGWLEWEKCLAQLENEKVRDRGYKLTRDPEVKRLMDAVFAQSPFLTRCMLRDIGFFADLLKRGPTSVLEEIVVGLNEQLGGQTDRAGLMADLRRARQRVALAVALGDLGGRLDLDEVTGWLSDFADAALRVCLRHLLAQAQHKGQMAPPAGPDPLTDCGYTILGMGKLGARELN